MQHIQSMEDLHIGQKFTAGPVRVTAEEIVAFAQKFDPQDFHLDPVKAKATLFGEQVASGWHTASLTMRMIVDITTGMKGGLVGRTVEKINWPRPVRPNDVLTLEVEIIELRDSAKMPSHGMMRTKNITYNQDRKPVMEMETVVFVPKRTA